MWLPWRKSQGRTRISSSNFSCSTFKDIQCLCKEEQETHQNQPNKPSVFHRVRISTSVLCSWSSCPIQPELLPPESNSTEPSISFPGSENRIVVYFTSLRVVRKTFEDCRTVRSILRGFRVFIDERDLSMDARFLEELQRILGKKKQLSLPRVFIGGRYVGGAEEIRQLHEIGELKKLVEGFPPIEPGVCDECGGYRFVLCDQCNGSHKCYHEKSGFSSCLACNENGLIMCSTCSSVHM